MKMIEIKKYLGRFVLVEANGSIYTKSIHGVITGIEGDKYLYVKDNMNKFHKFEIRKIKNITVKKFSNEKVKDA